MFIGTILWESWCSGCPNSFGFLPCRNSLNHLLLRDCTSTRIEGSGN
uniref:Reductase n=1 Tax=Siphoviridae sp. ctNEy24 TaxID=2825466 RepID=A0A8S5U0G8_9CAUD|nr:MAG TPA: reductase [Siphoviridae sp. ctNEy24]